MKDTLYKNAGLIFKASEDIDMESAEIIAVFNYPVSFDASSTEKPVNIHKNLIWPETRVCGTFSFH